VPGSLARRAGRIHTLRRLKRGANGVVRGCGNLGLVVMQLHHQKKVELQHARRHGHSQSPRPIGNKNSVGSCDLRHHSEQYLF